MKFVKLHEAAIAPRRDNVNSAGLDLFGLDTIEVKPLVVTRVPTGIAVVPSGDLLFWGRSGLGSKGIVVLAGCLDIDYRGELIVLLGNVGSDIVVIERGKAICQVLQPSQLVKEEIIEIDMSEFERYRHTERGSKGFGSSDWLEVWPKVGEFYKIKDVGPYFLDDSGNFYSKVINKYSHRFNWDKKVAFCKRIQTGDNLKLFVGGPKSRFLLPLREECAFFIHENDLYELRGSSYKYIFTKS